MQLFLRDIPTVLFDVNERFCLCNVVKNVLLMLDRPKPGLKNTPACFIKLLEIKYDENMMQFCFRSR